MILGCVIVILCAGLLIGKNVYANHCYQLGKNAYESEDYDTAVTQLHQAMKWDKTSQEILEMYFDASYKTEQYSNLINTYEKLDILTTEQNIQLVESFEQVIEDYIDESNKTKAIQLLQQVNERYPSQKYTYQILALRAEESVTDDYGITWNKYGQIENIDAYNHQIAITYEDGHFSSMVNENGKEVTGFDYSEENTTYEVTFSNGIPPWTNVRKVQDTDGNTTLIETVSEGDRDVVTYTYHKNSAGRIDKESQWHLLDDSSSTWEYSYEDGILQSKNQTVLGASQGNYVLYTYDAQGRLSSIQEYQNLITLIYEESYTYNEDGIIIQIVRNANGLTQTIDYTIEAYQQVYATITEDGEIVADQYAVDNNGWITIERKDDIE